jgi:hypothetical protein
MADLVITGTDIGSAGAIFDPSLPTLKDHVRLALGDKHDQPTIGVVSDALLQDAVIEAKITAVGYVQALAELAEALASQYAQMPDQYSESGGLTLRWGERVSAWHALAAAARGGKIAIPGATPRSQRSPAAVRMLTAQRTLTSPCTSNFRSD